MAYLVAEILDHKENENVFELPFNDGHGEPFGPLYFRLVHLDEDSYNKVQEESYSWSFDIKCYDHYDDWGYNDYQNHEDWELKEPLSHTSLPIGYLIKNGAFIGVFFLNHDNVPTGALTILGSRYGVVDEDITESSENVERSRGKKYYLERIAVRHLIIKDGVNEIKEKEYSYSNGLETVTIPSSVTSIGPEAFSYCPNLKKITLPLSCKVDPTAFKESPNATLIYHVKNIFDFMAVTNKCDCSICFLDENNNLLTDLIIPEGIEEIPEYAFARCISINTIKFPSTLKRIKSHAFDLNIALQELILPNSLEVIEKDAFLACDYIDITLPIGTKVEEDAFMLTNFKSLTFIRNVELDFINFPWKYVASRNNDIHLIDLEGNEVEKIIVPEGAKEIKKYALQNFKYIKEVVLPSTIKSIELLAFGGCTSLEKINFPDSLKIVAERSFIQCTSLREITFPKKMDSIGYDAFFNCSSLSIINMPEEIKEIGHGAFNFCPISVLRIPNGIKAIESDFLSHIEDNELTIYLPKSVKKIKTHAFSNIRFKAIYAYEGLEMDYQKTFDDCPSLPEIFIIVSNKEVANNFSYPATLIDENYKPIENKELVVEDDITVIKEGEYKNNNILTSITISKNVKTIRKGAFYNCKNLKEVIFLGPIDTIEEGAFSFSGITKLNIPEGVREIKKSAFDGCFNLEEVYIPQRLKLLGFDVFDSCDALKKVTIPTSVKQMNYDRFGCDHYEKVEVNYILNTSIDEFISHRDFKVREGHLFDSNGKEIEEITITNKMKLHDSALMNFKNIKKVTIEKGITHIPLRAFKGMDNLTSIILPPTLQQIGYNAFEECISLESITFDSPNLDITNEAFLNCRNLKEIFFNGKVIISASAFRGCESLKDVLINEYGGPYIGNKCFKDCKALETFRINGVSITEDRMFEGCDNLKLFDGGNTVRQISGYMFKDCPSLKRVYLPSTLETLYLCAFIGCHSLKTIYYDGTKKEWEENVTIETDLDTGPSEDDLISMILDNKKEKEPVVNFEDTVTKIITVKCNDDDEFQIAVRV